MCHLSMRRWSEKEEKGRDLESYKVNRENIHILKIERATINPAYQNKHTGTQTDKQLTLLMHPIFPSLVGNDTIKMEI